MEGRTKVFTVSEVNTYIKLLMEKDLFLSYIYVKGEISNLKIHTSGHMYFTLKDRNSRIKCVMFKSSVSKIKFIPEEGMQVVVRGYFSVYERDGQYQLYSESLILEGTGELYKAYEQLKNRLQKQGFFDKNIKKPLPFYPKRVAIITSPTGAAVRDMISIIKRRNPNVNILLYPVLVQGPDASGQIAEGLKYFNEANNVDVIIVGRGGGSIEELWAFNEELVARAIYESKIPVVSAVGHETDYTIADFVADERAATPSAAAEIVVPEIQQLRSNLKKIDSQMYLGILSYIKSKRVRLDDTKKSYTFRIIETKVANFRQTLETLKNKLNDNMELYVRNDRENLKRNVEKLSILNPASNLLRGYSFVKKKEDGTLITSVKQISVGENIKVIVKDGSILATVKSKCKGD
ncbi:MAG: exodeoxyribonuclease VII large subunit [Clostridiales bacterium]|nr:exodeoxyribonuclease VII large subunit [Clostridiales bacterium]